MYSCTILMSAERNMDVLDGAMMGGDDEGSRAPSPSCLDRDARLRGQVEVQFPGSFQVLGTAPGLTPELNDIGVTQAVPLETSSRSGSEWSEWSRHSGLVRRSWLPLCGGGCESFPCKEAGIYTSRLPLTRTFKIPNVVKSALNNIMFPRNCILTAGKGLKVVATPLNKLSL